MNGWTGFPSHVNSHFMYQLRWMAAAVSCQKIYSCMTLTGRHPIHLDFYYIYHMHIHTPIHPPKPSPDTHLLHFDSSHRLSTWWPYSWQAFSFLKARRPPLSSMVGIFSWSVHGGVEAESIHPCNKLHVGITHQPPLEIKTIPSSVKFFSSRFICCLTILRAHSISDGCGRFGSRNYCSD